MNDQPPKTLIAIGDNCLDVSLSRDVLTVGGNALNVAVQWRRHGWNSRYLGAVADDPEGRLVLDSLAPVGLSGEDVDVLPGVTGVTLLTDVSGERRILLEQLGVGIGYNPPDDRFADIARADWVHLGTHADAGLVRRLVAMGIGFSIDLSMDHFSLPLAGVPLAFASGPEDPEQPVEPLIAALRKAGAAQVLMTCGRRGAFFDDGAEITFEPALTIPVVDTCGAGDTFFARFLTAWKFEGIGIQQALSLAAADAARTCGHYGGFRQPSGPVPGWLKEKYKSVINQVRDV